MKDRYALPELSPLLKFNADQSGKSFHYSARYFCLHVYHRQTIRRVRVRLRGDVKIFHVFISCIHLPFIICDMLFDHMQSFVYSHL